MIFGSISYLNLLPFQVFLKRAVPNSQFKQSIRYRRGVPSRINSAFQKHTINAAFISSVTSSKCRCTDLGIIADGPVYSVFVIPGENEIDRESASSNVLAHILGLQGKIIIGDKALQHFLSGGEGIDLARQWKKETGLPFVFARLCYNDYGREVKSLAVNFAKQKIRVPQTILKKEAKKRGITPKELLWYLDHIKYKMDHQAKKSLKLFLKKSKKITA
ncbi:MAG: MqnA/MqnD/SBP family protein [Campylobacterota bacterium]|nr:MqnA/MqnD/SBP family protein [Campylobacterota bacterium]